MSELFHQIESVCPECLTPIRGKLVPDDDKILLEKDCPTHGRFRSTIWRGEPSFDSWVRPKLPYDGGERHASNRGCPRDCGLCSNHKQRTCTALVEVTSRCNLSCPVCFADSGGNEPDPDLETLRRTLNQLMTTTGGCNLQISGGEPTVRNDLPAIVSMAREVGFTFIQLNSNGLRLAENPYLALQLRDAGLSSVFLQFDGITDDVFSILRGRTLFQQKCRAIDNLAAAGVGVVLVPTIAPGMNTCQLWKIVQFGLDRQPHVRGVHFQPISYFGRFPRHFTPEHVTLPELMQALVRDSGGTLQLDDFRPPGCEHALCSFSARYLVKEDNTLQLLGAKNSCDCSPQPAMEGALTSIEATARQWQGVLPMYMENDNEPDDDLSRFLHRARTHTFQISAMAFQDCWTLNLERLQGCCIHVAQEDGRLIPFCSFNLTSRDGRSLHRNRVDSSGIDIPVSPVDQLVARRFGIQDNWNRRSLDEAMFTSLRRTIRHALANSPFYREKLVGLHPDGLNGWKDISGIPMMTSEDIVHNNHRLLCTSQSQVARVVTLQTSGSTGQPKRLMFSESDLDATLDFFFHGMQSLINGSDSVLVMLPYEQPDSVGDLLLRALTDGGIHAFGEWPPRPETVNSIREKQVTCAVGLPQHLLALAENIGPGLLHTMLLCSDYSSPALRNRIEKACGCTTFLHYGTTESGLGGGVECRLHDGCHIWESELLVEIVDPECGVPLADGRLGEVVITTLDRRAMPLIRYRTSDLARLDRSPCGCGGITARLYDIRGRLRGCSLNGGILYSQDLDDELFRIPGLLDYRTTLDKQGSDRLKMEYIAKPSSSHVREEIGRRLQNIPVIRSSLARSAMELGEIRQCDQFAASHTVKRTILDLRTQGELDATCS